MEYLPSRSLTARPRKMVGKGRRSGFLLGWNGNFSGAFAVKLREGTYGENWWNFLGWISTPRTYGTMYFWHLSNCPTWIGGLGNPPSKCHQIQVNPQKPSFVKCLALWMLLRNLAEPVEQWKKTWLVRLYRGWKPTRLYMRIVISHYKDQNPY